MKAGTSLAEELLEERIKDNRIDWIGSATSRRNKRRQVAENRQRTCTVKNMKESQRRHHQGAAECIAPGRPAKDSVLKMKNAAPPEHK